MAQPSERADTRVQLTRRRKKERARAQGKGVRRASARAEAVARRGDRGGRDRWSICLGWLPARGVSAPWIIRTALCTEVRNGVLRVFMPRRSAIWKIIWNWWRPSKTPPPKRRLRYSIEGYTLAARSSRLNIIGVTPDPGVIEVNTNPAPSWDELVKNTSALYEEARQTRLGTEKFMMDSNT